MNASYDIAIIGAGPAGSTLARLIGGRYRVLLVDRRRLDRGQTAGPRKCCGGLLAPDAQRRLAQLGLGLPRSVLVEPQLFVVRALDLESRQERYYQRHYINVDREAFDRWLVSLVPPQVETLFGHSLVALEPRGAPGLVLRLRGPGGESSFEAAAIVGADGARSLVRRLAFPGRPAFPLLTAVQALVACERQPPACFLAIFDRQATDYYAWAIPKGEGILVGTAVRRAAEGQTRLDVLQRKLAGYGYRFGRRLRLEAGAIARPGPFAQLPLVGKRLALVGEAAGLISPSSAEGLSYAFGSALALAGSLQPGIDGFEERYERGAWKLKLALRLKHFKSAAIHTPWLRRLALGTGFQSIPVIRPQG